MKEIEYGSELELYEECQRLAALNAELVAALEAIVGLAQATTGSATNVKTLWRVREKARAALKAAKEQT